MKIKILLASIFFFVVYKAQSIVSNIRNEKSGTEIYWKTNQIVNKKTVLIEEQTKNNDTIVYTDNSVTVKPEFPGGNETFNAHVNIFVKKENNIKHDVFVSFIVEKTGEVSNIKIFRSVDTTNSEETDKEIIEIIKNSPRWKPGELLGKKVRCMVPLFLTIDGKY